MAHRVKRYRMDFEGKGPFRGAVLIGFAVFLRILYYFGFLWTEMVGLKELLMYLVIPAVFETSFIILLRGVRLKLPLVYGILGAVYCVLLIVQCLQHGDVLGIVLSVFFYVVCGALLVVVSLGLLSKEIGVTMCFATAIMRLVFSGVLFTGYKLGIMPLLSEACTFIVLCAMAYFTMGMKEPKN
ncbi:MAG: hypothetical protein IJV82_01980 [Oscillospiraceae bacterium]|nr:hypothetical protein [Oscillospiraceae bacterium]